MTLSYAVLRAEVDTSIRRVCERSSGGPDLEPVVRDLHRLLSGLGELEAHVIDSTGLSPEQVAAEVRAGLSAGRFGLC